MFSKEIQRAVHKGIPFFNDINSYTSEEHTLFTTFPRKINLHNHHLKLFPPFSTIHAIGSWTCVQEVHI